MKTTHVRIWRDSKGRPDPTADFPVELVIGDERSEFESVNFTIAEARHLSRGFTRVADRVEKILLKKAGRLP